MNSSYYFRFLPSVITLVRLLLLIVFGSVCAMYHGDLWSVCIMLFIYTMMSITDFVDGFVASKYGARTTLGKFFDPLVDGCVNVSAMMLICSCIIKCGIVFPILLIWRDCFINLFRVLAAREGIVLEARQSGKWKSCIIMVSIISSLFAIVLVNLGVVSMNSARNLSMVLFMVSSAASWASLVDYFFNVNNVLWRCFDLEE